MPEEIKISIHVPARGTTKIINILEIINRISIHVPARGTTFKIHTRRQRIRDFNPRSREGNDADLS